MGLGPPYLRAGPPRPSVALTPHPPYQLALEKHLLCGPLPAIALASATDFQVSLPNLPWKLPGLKVTQ